MHVRSDFAAYIAQRTSREEMGESHGRFERGTGRRPREVLRFGSLIACLWWTDQSTVWRDPDAGVLVLLHGELYGEDAGDLRKLTDGFLRSGSAFCAEVDGSYTLLVADGALKMKERGIVPEIEIFETGMIQTTKVLMKRCVLVEPYYCNLLLGSMFSAPGTLFDLAHMVRSLPPGVVWSAAGIGRFQLKMNFAAVLMGGHVRVGLEDNLYYDHDRKTLATNRMLVQRVADFARHIGREVATPREARSMIGLKQTPTANAAG